MWIVIACVHLGQVRTAGKRGGTDLRTGWGGLNLKQFAHDEINPLFDAAR